MHVLLHELALVVVSAAAGAVNAVAGGGTLLTFPTLIGLGLSGVAANATSTVGLVPGSLGSVWGYRREVGDVSHWLAWLLPSSVAGGVVGALLLVNTPPAIFDALAPVLILFATALFMVQEALARRPSANAGAPHPWVVVTGQFFIAIYGGYFGGAMGIIMLAALGLLRIGDIHRMNGLKTFATAAINGVAALLFIVRGMVLWPEAITMAVGSTLGGFLAADAARKLGQKTIRRAVIAVGLIASAALVARRF